MSHPELVLAGMPLGNDNDVTLRFLEYSRSADIVLCESRRTAQSLMKKHGVDRPAGDFIVLDEHTTEADLQAILEECSACRRILLVSDAGMPVFCDPGTELLEQAEQRGWTVTILPGASALTLATVRAGINGPFFFAGFPPRETAERRRFFQELGKRTETIVLYETPYRITKLLEEMGSVLSGSEKVFVAVDLSGENERIFRFRLNEAGKVARTIPRGAPVVILDRMREKRRA